MAYLICREGTVKTGHILPVSLWVRKIAGLTADLRMRGLAGVARPPFPTSESLSHAFRSFKDTKKATTFKGFAKPSTLTKPGPSISQVATTPAVK